MVFNTLCIYRKILIFCVFNYCLHTIDLFFLLCVCGIVSNRILSTCNVFMITITLFLILQDTKYSCPHCKYQSIQSTSYKNHLSAKHPGLGGSFFCTLCSYHTVNENAYVAHISDHQNGLIKKNEKQGKILLC